MSDIVLCVDDQENVLHALQREMNRVADKVFLAQSGEEGLEVLRHETVSVVVSDMRMPGMEGAEFLKKVRLGWPDTFRIMLTGYADLSTITAGVNEGEIHRFIVKPWNSQEMQMAVKMGFDRVRLIQENRALSEQLEIQNVQLQDMNDHLEERVRERSQQLERAYSELAHSEKLSAVGRLSAGVVHEVLNPLTVATGRLEMMKLDERLSIEHQKNLRIGVEQILKAVKILDNLRDFSKQHPPERTWIDINKLISDAVDLLSHELSKKGINISKNLGSLKQIFVDHDQMSHIFLNFFGYALDAIKRGDNLTVTTVLRNREEKEGVEIRVVDTGEGISEENLTRIFDPFFTSKANGTGLGLSICQGIVENHEGKITANSVPGDGTTFLIWLPIGK
ncbi:MAG: hybrid sensor histidine kinase/response regulator [Candidatus Latescibacterota bacterium]